jgi:hypothetical protein
MSHSELALACAGVILQASVLIAMLRGGLQKRFPAFFVFMIFSVASTAVLWFLRDSNVLYRRVYWTTEALNSVVVFFALHEIFKALFRGFYNLPWFRLLFPGIGVLMLGLAVLRTLLRPMPAGDRAHEIIISLEIANGFLEIGIFFLFLALIWFFRVRSRQQAFGLALGFGIVASAYLVFYLLRSEFGTKFYPVLRVGPPIAYTLGLVVWLVTFLIKEPAPAQTGVTTGLTPEQMISDVKRYTEAAKRIFRQ